MCNFINASSEIPTSVRNFSRSESYSREDYTTVIEECSWARQEMIRLVGTARKITSKQHAPTEFFTLSCDDKSRRKGILKSSLGIPQSSASHHSIIHYSENALDSLYAMSGSPYQPNSAWIHSELNLR